jgi:hypothetical protein
MKALIPILVLFAVFGAGLLVALARLRKSSDPLLSRYRMILLSMCALAVAAIGMAASGSFSGGFAFLVVVAICELERRRLSRQLSERGSGNVS